MSRMNIEKHFLKEQRLLPANLAQDLLSHAGMGKTAVISQSPLQLLEPTKKEWHELSGHKDPALSFSATPPHDLLEADVTFATLQDYLRVPPICQIIYIAQDIDRLDLHKITSWMPSRSLIIIYAK